MFEIWGGGGIFNMQEKMYFALYFYMQKQIHFELRFYTQKAWNFALHFYTQKKVHFLLRFISKIYHIVLIPKYKRTYDQSNQIEK